MPWLETAPYPSTPASGDWSASPAGALGRGGPASGSGPRRLRSFS